MESRSALGIQQWVRGRFGPSRRWVPPVAIALIAVAIAACTGSSARATPQSGIRKIKHVIVIMQENRSFDSYFGTYPGATGIPPNVCIPDPRSTKCVQPYHDNSNNNQGGPHTNAFARADIDTGRMDGFLRWTANIKPCSSQVDPLCSPTAGIDSMGYHDARRSRITGLMLSNLYSRTICLSRMRLGACRLTYF